MEQKANSYNSGKNGLKVFVCLLECLCGSHRNDVKFKMEFAGRTLPIPALQ